MLELNAVIFDMDGLMIDTEPVGKMLVKTSHEKFGYEITEEMFYHLIGTNEKTSKAYYHSVFGEDYPYQKIKDYRDQLILFRLQDINIMKRKILKWQWLLQHVMNVFYLI